MADQKLSELAVLTSVSNDDLLYIVRSGVSKRITVSSVASTINVPKLVAASNTSVSLTLVATVPSTSTSTGTTGQLAYDSAYLYLCVATNTWKRSALTTW
jgi:hypothetical protein